MRQRSTGWLVYLPQWPEPDRPSEHVEIGGAVVVLQPGRDLVRITWPGGLRFLVRSWEHVKITAQVVVVQFAIAE